MAFGVLMTWPYSLTCLRQWHPHGCLRLLFACPLLVGQSLVLPLALRCVNCTRTRMRNHIARIDVDAWPLHRARSSCEFAVPCTVVLLNIY